MSATPGDYEEKVSQAKVDQVIRPTGLLDPEIVVRTSSSQIDDIIDEAKERAARNERVLITTLTKKMAEDLTDHLLDQGVKARYMHSDIATPVSYTHLDVYKRQSTGGAPRRFA